MTQDEIMEMAREASVFGYVYDAGDTPHLWQFDNKQLQAFANLVAAKEKEACAKKGTNFYTATPQRTWVGLSKEQLATTDWSADFRAGALWAEAKLKERNDHSI